MVQDGATAAVGHLDGGSEHVEQLGKAALVEIVGHDAGADESGLASAIDPEDAGSSGDEGLEQRHARQGGGPVQGGVRGAVEGEVQILTGQPREGGMMGVVGLGGVEEERQQQLQLLLGGLAGRLR